MGERGPISKNESKNAVTIQWNGAITIPRHDVNWHPYAKQWWTALQESPQSTLYESSDWMQAFIMADILSKMLMRGVYSAEVLKAWMAGATSLGVTIGDRRRMGVEVKRLAAGGAAEVEVSPYDEYAQMIENAPPED